MIVAGYLVRDNGNAVEVTAENGDTVRVPVLFFLEKIEGNEKIPEELWETCKREEQIYLCRRYALRSLACAPCVSRKQLLRKMRLKRFSKEVADATADALVDEGYLTEEENRQILVEMMENKGWDERRIRMELRKRGFEGES